MVNFHLIKNSDISHILLGTKKQISNKKQYYCEVPNFNASDCLYGTGEYAFWEGNGQPYSTPVLVNDFQKDGIGNRDARDFQYKPNSRGTKYLTSIVLEKNFKTMVRRGQPAPKTSLPEDMSYEWPHLPYLQNNEWLNDKLWSGIESLISSEASDGSIPDQNAFIPMCDTIKIHVQNPPVITKRTLPSFVKKGEAMYADVNYSYDTKYSYAAKNNKQITFTWTFDNIDLPSSPNEVVITETPYINYNPRYSGEYKVKARINDGKFSQTTTLGYVMFAGGDNCPRNQCGDVH